MPVPVSAATERPPATDFISAMKPHHKPGSGSAGGVLQCDPNEDFFLVHYPTNWRPSVHLETQCWIPMLGKHVLAPGVNGCRTLRQNEDPIRAYEDSVYAMKKKGWTYINPETVIPQEYLPAGMPEGGYVRALPCRGVVSNRAGTRHLEAWDVPGDTLADDDQEFTYDHAAHERYCAWLVVTGQIKPPSQKVIDRLVRTATRRLDHVEALVASKQLGDASTKRRMDALQLHEDAEVPEEVPAAKPKQTRKRRTTPKRKPAAKASK